MRFPRLSFLTFGLALLLICPVGAQAGDSAGQSGAHLSAELNGQPIPLSDVVRYHCHDLLAPRILCFATEPELEADFSATASLLFGPLTVAYALWYQDIDFGGASFADSASEPDLSVIGWGNRISSFKSTNGGHPKWWDSTSYSGTSWQWCVSCWVSYVGDGANDRFSSIKNVP